jgi:outer membrane lipoprotein
MRAASLAVLIAMLTGCVSAFPDEDLRGVNRAATLATLRAAPESHVDERVILGGEILSTRPGPGGTEVEILSRRLRRDDRPERSDRSDGRFLVRTKEFLDPAVYATGRRLTVIGRAAGGEERKIGELPYRYPVIQAERLVLWPRDVVVAPPPYAYDPFWDPYWGPFWRPYRPYYRLWRPWPYWW